MVRSTLFLLVVASAATTVHGLFSVNDDILAFPQYEIQFRSGPIAEAEASTRLAQAPTSSAHSASPTSTSTPGSDTTGISESYEALWLNGLRYLCSVPVVKPPPALNATEKELSRAAEEKELARATMRGWELLSELEGECLYFVSGWWSYSYCHNREVRQFHQKTPGGGPPTEDPGTPSYVLGMVSEEKRTKEKRSKVEGRGDKGGGTELQATGELRFLVQKLGGGTTCDLTRKERKIEIQFHCHPQGVDRIGWIKEISICCYLMVVYTPRLCNDVAFLPPREDRANGVQCREVLDSRSMENYYKVKAKSEQADALELLREAAQTALGLAPGDGLGGSQEKVIEGGENKADKKADKKADNDKGKIAVKEGGEKKGEKVVVSEEGIFDDEPKEELEGDGWEDVEGTWVHFEL